MSASRLNSGDLTMLHVLLLSSVCRSERSYTEWRKTPCGPKWSDNLCAHLPLCTSITIHKSSLTCILSNTPTHSNNTSRRINGEVQYMFTGGNGTRLCGDNTRIIKSKGKGYKCVPVPVVRDEQRTVKTIDYSTLTFPKPERNASSKHYHSQKSSTITSRSWRLPSSAKSSYRRDNLQSQFGTNSFSNRFGRTSKTNQQRRIGNSINANQLLGSRYGSNSNLQTQQSGFNRALRPSSKTNFYSGLGRNRYLNSRGGARNSFSFNERATNGNQNVRRLIDDNQRRRQDQQQLPRFMRPRQPMHQRRNPYRAPRMSYGNDPNARTRMLLAQLGMS